MIRMVWRWHFKGGLEIWGNKVGLCILCTQSQLQNFRRNVKPRPYRLFMSLPSRRPYLTHINAVTSVTWSSFGPCPRHRIVSGRTYYPCIWTDRWCWNCSQSPEVEIVEEVMYRAYLHPHGHQQAERMKMLTQLKRGLSGILTYFLSFSEYVVLNR